MFTPSGVIFPHALRPELKLYIFHVFFSSGCWQRHFWSCLQSCMERKGCSNQDHWEWQWTERFPYWGTVRIFCSAACSPHTSHTVEVIRPWCNKAALNCDFFLHYISLWDECGIVFLLKMAGKVKHNHKQTTSLQRCRYSFPLIKQSGTQLSHLPCNSAWLARVAALSQAALLSKLNSAGTVRRLIVLGVEGGPKCDWSCSNQWSQHLRDWQAQFTTLNSYM